MIQLETQNSIGILRLQHGKVNTIDLELFTELIKKLEEVEKSESKALVLTGAGSAFSAGVDLFRVLEGGESYLDSFLPLLTDGLLKLFTFSKPVVAAVNGHAIAGGCILACASDYRLMAKGEGKIGVPELLLGVPFPALPLEIVRFVVPNNFFQQLIYTGRTCSPEEAARVGFIDKVVEPEHLLTQAIAMAERLAAIPTQSFNITKQQLHQPVLDSYEKYREIYDKKVVKMWKSSQIHAVIEEYLQRTIGK